MTGAWYFVRFEVQKSRFERAHLPAYFKLGEEYGISDLLFFLGEFKKHIEHVFQKRGFYGRISKIVKIKRCDITNVGEQYKVDMTEIVNRLYGQHKLA